MLSELQSDLPERLSHGGLLAEQLPGFDPARIVPIDQPNDSLHHLSRRAHVLHTHSRQHWLTPPPRRAEPIQHLLHEDCRVCHYPLHDAGQDHTRG
eukprot:44328-Eustigmatos_ZCMA.PRE.1